MIHKHGIDKKIKSQKISSLFPGCGISSEDTGLGTIGKIDHARIPSGITIKMHPHINDDILSYFRTGVSKHMDSENISAEISRKRLMLMQAGSIFYHEERILEPLEGLQIFIRPLMRVCTYGFQENLTAPNVIHLPKNQPFPPLPKYKLRKKLSWNTSLN